MLFPIFLQHLMLVEHALLFRLFDFLYPVLRCVLNIYHVTLRGSSEEGNHRCTGNPLLFKIITTMVLPPD